MTPPVRAPIPVIPLPQEDDCPPAPRALAVATRVAWIGDVLYVGLHAVCLLHPLLLLMYVFAVGMSIEHLRTGRHATDAMRECLIWIEPLMRIALASMALRAGRRMARGGADVPRVDLWGYVVLRLALTSLVVSTCWLAPSAMPFITPWNVLDLFDHHATPMPGTPTQVLASVVWVVLDLIPPLAVAFGLMAPPCRKANAPLGQFTIDVPFCDGRNVALGLDDVSDGV